MRFLFAGGGTGGHLCPGLALADMLRSIAPMTEVVFVGTANGMEQSLVPAAGYKLERVATGRGSPLSLETPLNAPRFLFALWQSFRLIRRLNPSAVVALGGYAAAAPGLVASLLKVPVVVLEQNTVPGRVTRLLSRYARRVHLQFAEARPFLAHPERALHTGSPARPALTQLMAQPLGSGDALLVLGGSQGAKPLNDLVLAAMPRLIEGGVTRVIHQAGEAHETAVRAAYAPFPIETKIIGFTGEIASLYASAAVVISRAGAGGCSEAALAGAATILIPFPQAMDDHQRKNAASLVAAGAARCLEQVGLTPERLADEILLLYGDKAERQRLGAAMRRTARPEAASVIARELLASGLSEEAS